MPWILVQTKVRRERYADANVRAQGLETLMPMAQTIQSVNGKVKKKAAPLYPGYLFVKIKYEWWFLRSTYGVVTVVMMGGQPVKVPIKIIRHLRKQMGKEGVITIEEDERFKKGQKVRIRLKGPLEDVVGIYQETTPEGRIRVLLEILGKETMKELRERDVEEAG